MKRMLYGPPAGAPASARGGPPAAEAVPVPNTLGPKAAATVPAAIVFRASLRPASTSDCVAFAIAGCVALRVSPTRRTSSCSGAEPQPKISRSPHQRDAAIAHGPQRFESRLVHRPELRAIEAHRSGHLRHDSAQLFKARRVQPPGEHQHVACGLPTRGDQDGHGPRDRGKVDAIADMRVTAESYRSPLHRARAAKPRYIVTMSRDIVTLLFSLGYRVRFKAHWRTSERPSPR